MTMIDEKRMKQIACDAPMGMSRFQIERFVVQAEPPIGRYFQCALEIKTRLATLESIRRNLVNAVDAVQKGVLLQKIAALEDELNIFASLAEEWIHLTQGRTWEEVQPEYWDQRLAYDLCMRLVSSQPFNELVRPILALHDGAVAKRLLMNIGKGTPDKAEVMKILDGWTDKSTKKLEGS